MPNPKAGRKIPRNLARDLIRLAYSVESSGGNIDAGLVPESDRNPYHAPCMLQEPDKMHCSEQLQEKNRWTGF